MLAAQHRDCIMQAAKTTMQLSSICWPCPCITLQCLDHMMSTHARKHAVLTVITNHWLVQALTVGSNIKNFQMHATHHADISACSVDNHSLATATLNNCYRPASTTASATAALTMISSGNDKPSLQERAVAEQLPCFHLFPARNNHHKCQ